MKLAFMYANKVREYELGQAVLKGFPGEKALIYNENPVPEDADIVGMVGVKSKKLFDDCLSSGKHVLIFDKGYQRRRRMGSQTWEYWRVSIDSHHPTRFLKGQCPGDRFKVKFHDWTQGDEILIAGSSAKYHAFYGLEDPTTYYTSLVNQIKRHTDRPIRYRPKPTWGDAVPIPGATTSDQNESLKWALDRAFVMVTHGSNACFESILYGVPCIILGDAVAKPISSTSIKKINDPKMVRDNLRTQWFNNLSYWQWTEEEMASGEMWRFLESKF